MDEIIKYYVYILKSLKDDTLYIGLTNNLKRRLQQHNNGTNFSTKHKIPLILIYKEIACSLVEARKREKYFKSGCGREFIKSNIIKMI